MLQASYESESSDKLCVVGQSRTSGIRQWTPTTVFNRGLRTSQILGLLYLQVYFEKLHCLVLALRRGQDSYGTPLC